MRNLLSVIFTLLLLISVPVYADSLESVRVVKFWEDTDDMIVEDATGDQLLIQHNRGCSSMSTEFPVKLVWDEGEVVELKVAANEICDVYDWGSYSSDIKIIRRINSSNYQIPTHNAEIEWNGGLYNIDYEEGCTNMRDYENHIAYVYTPENTLEGGTLYLPKDRGQCRIAEATHIEDLEEDIASEDMIKNLLQKAENNQVLFSWEKFPEDENWIALVTYSKFRFDPNEYSLSQMPNLRRTRDSSILVRGLVNNQKYYFYITSSNSKGEGFTWHEVEVTPIQTAKRIVNIPFAEQFEIEMEETDDAFILTWPDQAEHSKRYLIQLYVDGKREVFKTIGIEKPQYIIEKKPEWSKSRFRMILQSIPKKPTELRFFDSIFWRKG